MINTLFPSISSKLTERLPGSINPAKLSEYYRVRITSGGVGVIGQGENQNTNEEEVIKAYVQKNFKISTSSEWSAPFANLGSNATLDTLLSIMGLSLRTTTLSTQVWRGTSPLRMRLTFELHAEHDALTEVVIPARQLLSLALPSTNSRAPTVLVPPGPNLFGEIAREAVGAVNKSFGTSFSVPKIATDSGQTINIYISKFLEFKRIIVTDVSTDFATKFDIKGYPMSAAIDIGFTTHTVVTKGTLRNIIVGN